MVPDQGGGGGKEIVRLRRHPVDAVARRIVGDQAGVAAFIEPRRIETQRGVVIASL